MFAAFFGSERHFNEAGFPQGPERRGDRDEGHCALLQ